MDIYKQVLSSVLRHFLSILAGALGTYGVSEGMQSQLVEATVAIVVSFALGGFALLLSKWDKQFTNQVAAAALVAPPTATMEQVVAKVEKTNAVEAAKT